jgi:hypothetical protein
MAKTLDCSSYESAKESVSTIFEIDESELSEFLKSIQSLPTEEEYTEYIYKVFCNKFGPPKGHSHTIWFHGTRTNNIESFKKEGILPKSDSIERVRSALITLSDGLEKVGENPFSMSLAGKQAIIDEGPFAVLIKDVAIHAPGFAHSYIETPEIVEDIAGALFGTNYIHLVERFKAISKPYIISFSEKACDYELRHAVWYLYLVESGEDKIDSSGSASTCFDSRGSKIPPEKIKTIEEIACV